MAGFLQILRFAGIQNTGDHKVGYALWSQHIMNRRFTKQERYCIMKKKWIIPAIIAVVLLFRNDVLSRETVSEYVAAIAYSYELDRDYVIRE